MHWQCDGKFVKFSCLVPKIDTFSTKHMISEINITIKHPNLRRLFSRQFNAMRNIIIGWVSIVLKYCDTEASWGWVESHEMCPLLTSVELPEGVSLDLFKFSCHLTFLSTNSLSKIKNYAEIRLVLKNLTNLIFIFKAIVNYLSQMVEKMRSVHWLKYFESLP